MRAVRWLAAVLVVGIGVAVALVERGRSAVVAYALPSATGGSPVPAIPDGVEMQVRGLMLAGGLAIGVLVLVWLAGMDWRSRPSRGGPVRAALFLPLLPVALGILAYGWAVSRGYHGAADIDPALKSEHLRQALESSGRWLGVARVAWWLALGLSAVAGLVWARRAPLVPVTRLLAAVALCGAGFLAVVVTRGQAADRLPMPVLANSVLDLRPFEQTPRFASCPRQEESLPVLQFGSDAVTVDGVAVDPRGFGDHLMTTRSNYPAVHQGRPAPATLALVVAPGNTPMARLIPYLQKGVGGLWMMASVAPHPYLSRTLGAVPRYQHCGRRFRLSESAAPISRYPTWAALAAAMDKAPATLEAAPW